MTSVFAVALVAAGLLAPARADIPPPPGGPKDAWNRRQIAKICENDEERVECSTLEHGFEPGACRKYDEDPGHYLLARVGYSRFYCKTVPGRPHPRAYDEAKDPSPAFDAEWPASPDTPVLWAVGGALVAVVVLGMSTAWVRLARKSRK